MKDIEIILSEKIERSKELIYQNFYYNKKDKNIKFIKDSRYILYDKFNKYILNSSLCCDGVEYSKTTETEGGITLEYIITDDNKIKDIPFGKVKYKTFIDIIPDYPGCSFCVYRKKLTDVFYFCEYKDKALNKDIKNCKWFKQRNLC